MSDINSRLIIVRNELKLNQKQVAEQLGLKQSYYSGVENSKRKVTSRVIEGLRKNFNVSSDWLLTGNGNIFLTKSNKSVPLKNVPLDGDLKKKYHYAHKFHEYIVSEIPEYKQLREDVFEILSSGEFFDALHDTKIGDVTLFAVDNLRKVENFKEFKEIGLQSIESALPYKEIIHEYAECLRKFVKKIAEVKDQIEMDFDFEDYDYVTPKP